MCRKAHSAQKGEGVPLIDGKIRIQGEKPNADDAKKGCRDIVEIRALFLDDPI